MKPPFFIWKSGTLDAFDSIEELEKYYPADKLAGEDFVACDSEGRVISAGRGSDGALALTCDEQQSPSPDTLRAILRGYLGQRGQSSDELDTLPLSDLVLKAYPPPDPRLAQIKWRFIFTYVVLPVVFFLCFGIYMLIKFLCGLSAEDHLIR